MQNNKEWTGSFIQNEHNSDDGDDNDDEVSC